MLAPRSTSGVVALFFTRSFAAIYPSTVRIVLHQILLSIVRWTCRPSCSCLQVVLAITQNKRVPLAAKCCRVAFYHSSLTVVAPLPRVMILADENIANLFKKIKGGVYSMPGYLSEGCRDLIPRMLVVDPLMRINVFQLRQHAWFLTNLPSYLSAPADVVRPLGPNEGGNPKAQAKTLKFPCLPDEDLNPDVLVELCRRLEVKRQEAVEALKSSHSNQMTVAYNLLLDARKTLDSLPLHIKQVSAKRPADFPEFWQNQSAVSFSVLKEAASLKALQVSLCCLLLLLPRPRLLLCTESWIRSCHLPLFLLHPSSLLVCSLW